MDIDIFKAEIDKRLVGTFERELVEASLSNLEDVKNKLRFNNFSYSIRELTRHILERLAPYKNVMDTTWFKPNDPKKPKQITRKQRMKYAIQAGLSDTYIEEELGIDVEEIGNKVTDAINLLSKYTHVNPSTFNIPDADVKRMSESVMKAVILLFETIEESRKLLVHEMEESINKSIISNLFFDTIDSIDYLATHYEIEEFNVYDIVLQNIDESDVYFQANGTVSVKLQYGSDGDLRRGDGMTIEESFPFSGEFYGKICDNMSSFELETDTFEVDTDSHWGEDDDYIEKLIEEAENEAFKDKKEE